MARICRIRINLYLSLKDDIMVMLIFNQVIRDEKIRTNVKVFAFFWLRQSKNCLFLLIGNCKIFNLQ